MASRHQELHLKPIGNLFFPRPLLGINSAFFVYVDFVLLYRNLVHLLIL